MQSKTQTNNKSQASRNRMYYQKGGNTVKKLIAVICVIAIFTTMFVGCKKGSGLFGMTKSEINTDTQTPTAPAETEDKLAALQEDFAAWYEKYDAFTSELSEEYSVFKLITPKYVEQIPDRLGDLVDKYIFPETTTEVPGTNETTQEP